MKQLITTMTQRGQVTIPAEVRQKFGLSPGDKVMFTIQDDHVSVSPVEFTLQDAFGSVEPIHRPEDIDELIRQAKEERARKLVERQRTE